MANKISDETIEYVGILAKLELSDEEKEQAKKDMETMLDYIDTLNELNERENKCRSKTLCYAMLNAENGYRKHGEQCDRATPRELVYSDKAKHCCQCHHYCTLDQCKCF